MVNYLKSFEEITDVYDGFRLKENFMKAGTEALKKCGNDIIFAPVMKEGNICFTVSAYPLFEDEILMDMAWEQGFDVETLEDAEAALPEEAAWVVAVNVSIHVREENGELYVGGVNGEYVGLDHELKLLDPADCGYPDDVDDDSVFAAVEAFLDSVVDTE